MQRDPFSNIDRPLTSFVCFVFLFFVIFLFPHSYSFPPHSSFLLFQIFPFSLLYSPLSVYLNNYFHSSLSSLFLSYFSFRSSFFISILHSYFLSSSSYIFIFVCSLLFTFSLVFLKECYRHITQRIIFSVNNGTFTGMRSQDTLNARYPHPLHRQMTNNHILLATYWQRRRINERDGQEATQSQKEQGRLCSILKHLLSKRLLKCHLLLKYSYESVYRYLNVIIVAACFPQWPHIIHHTAKPFASNVRYKCVITTVGFKGDGTAMMVSRSTAYGVTCLYSVHVHCFEALTYCSA
jgi:hypothetical protein